MRGVAYVLLLLVALLVHSVVAARPPFASVFPTPSADSLVEFSPTQTGAFFSRLQETARGSREEVLNGDDRRPQISQDFFLGHRDSPLAPELRTDARLPGAGVTSVPSYDQNFLFGENLQGNLAGDSFEFVHARPSEEVALEPSSVYERLFSESFPELSSEVQIRDPNSNFGRSRFRRSSDESKLMKKKIRSHFLVQSTSSDQKPGIDNKKNSARSVDNRRDGVSSIETGKPEVQERSFQEKSGSSEYKSGKDSAQQSSSYRYSPIGLRRDEDDRPDYYFKENAGVDDRTNDNQNRNPHDQFSNIDLDDTGFNKFSFFESVDDFNKDFISTHPQTSQGSPDHHRSPYTKSKFKNAVEHKPPVKTQQYSENENRATNINHESHSFSDPHPTDVISESPYSPYTSSGTSNKEKTHYYDDKDRIRDPHVAYLGSSPYNRHPTEEGQTHYAGGEKENYYQSDGPTIYSPKKSNYDGHTASSPLHGGNIQNTDHHGYHRGENQDDRNGGSSLVYPQDDYNDRHNLRGVNSYAVYSGDDQNEHQRYHHDDHKSSGYEVEDGHNGFQDSRLSDDVNPYSKRAAQTSSHPNHSLETFVGNGHSDSLHPGQNIHPSNFDRSPFKPSHEFSTGHGHDGGYSFHASNAGGRAQDPHSGVKEGGHSPSHFTGLHGPLNDGGDFFHAEENIDDLPEFLGTGSRETDSHKFRSNEKFAPNDVVDSFTPLQLAEPYSRSPYTHEKRHTASYKQEKPFKQYENSLHSSDPSTFEPYRFQSSNKPVKSKYPTTQPHHPIGPNIGASFRSNPPHVNLSVRPRTRPPHSLPSHMPGPPVGSSLMRFFNNLPSINWSGRPTYRALPNSYYR